jgi:hypothetical protein
MGANRILRHYEPPAGPPPGRFNDACAAFLGAHYFTDPSAVPCPFHTHSRYRWRSPVVVLRYVAPDAGDWCTAPMVSPVGAYDVILGCRLCRKVARVSMLPTAAEREG